MKSTTQQLTGRSLDVIVALTLGYQWLRENKDGGLVMLCPPCFLDFRTIMASRNIVASRHVKKRDSTWISSSPPEPISKWQLNYISLYHNTLSCALELGESNWCWAMFQSAAAITIVVSVPDGDALQTVADVGVWRRDFPTLEEALATARCRAFLQAKEQDDDNS